MGILAFVTRRAQLILHSAPGQLTIFVLERSVQLTADGIEAVVNRVEDSPVISTVIGPVINPVINPVKNVTEGGEENEESDLGDVHVEDGEIKSEPGNTTVGTPTATDGYLVQFAKLSVALLRWIQKWLRSLRDEAPSTCNISAPVMEDRRRLVARKQLHEFGLVTRVFRCALYALTDALGNVGVTVGFLEYAKGTLHVSGDKSIDCSPVAERSSKRKEFDISDDEDEEEMGTLDQLEKSYNSQDDADYKQPTDGGVSTDSEEYRKGETESEESHLSGGEELPTRRVIKQPAGATSKPTTTATTGASATKPPVKSTNIANSPTKSATGQSGTAKTPAESTTKRSAKGSTGSSGQSTPDDHPKFIARLIAQIHPGSPPQVPTEAPAQSTAKDASTKKNPTATSKAEAKTKGGEKKAENVPKTDQAKKAIPVAKRTP